MTEPGPKGAETQRRILQAATALFSQKGYVRTSMEDIAARAGITKPAIYNYFRSKQEILDKILTDRNEVWLEKMHRVLASNAPLKDRLRHATQVALDFSAQSNDTLWVLVSAAAEDGLESEDDGSILRLREYISRFIAILTAMFERDKAAGHLKSHVEPQHVALTFFSMITLFMLSHKRTGLNKLIPGKLDEMATFIVEALLHGVAAD